MMGYYLIVRKRPNGRLENTMNGEMIWDKFEDMREVMGDTNLLIALADSLGTDKLYGELLYIDRVNDLGIFKDED
jgi:hypothetical protein